MTQTRAPKRSLDFVTSTDKDTGPAAAPLDECISAAIAAAKAPTHYVKQTLVPRTAPELFTSRTAEGKPCMRIVLDDGSRIEADLINVERQSVRIHAVNHESKPSRVDVPLKRRVW